MSISNPIYRVTSHTVSRLAVKLIHTQKYSLQTFSEALTGAILAEIGQDDQGSKTLAHLLAMTWLQGWCDRGLADVSATLCDRPLPCSHYKRPDGTWVHRDHATTEDRRGESAILWPNTLVRWV